MEKKFLLEICSPEKILFSEKVEAIVAPAYEGYLGVLVNHAPMICLLQPGELKITKDNKEQFLIISGGLMEVYKNNVLILADSAEKIEDIDVERAERSKERALNRLRHPTKEVDIKRAQLALKRAENRLRFVKKLKQK